MYYKYTTATSYMMFQAIICFMKHEYTEWIWKRNKQNQSSGSIEYRARFRDHYVFHINYCLFEKISMLKKWEEIVGNADWSKPLFVIACVTACSCFVKIWSRCICPY